MTASASFKEILGLTEEKEFDLVQLSEEQARELVEHEFIESELKFGEGEHTLSEILALLKGEDSLVFSGYVMFFSDKKPKLALEAVSFKASNPMSAFAWIQFFDDANDTHYYVDPTDKAVTIFFWWTS